MDNDSKCTIVFQNNIIYTPKISVIIPVYNVEKYLDRSLTSLTRQYLKEIELICIDDCSTDDSLEILKRYAQKDNRITIVSMARNVGAAVSRNKGLELAKGEYIGFVDPDDDIDLNFYEVLYKIAKSKNADIAKSGVINIDENGNRVVSDVIKNMKKTKFAFKHEWWSAIYKHQMIIENNIKLPEDCRKGHDGIFLILSLINAKKIVTTQKTYYYYYRRIDSLDARKIPYKSICSAMRVKSRMLDYLNEYKVYETDRKHYTYAYKIRLMSIFYNLLQNDSFNARYLCLKTFFNGFKRCKKKHELKKEFPYKWMIKYIDKDDIKGLLPKFLKANSSKDLNTPILSDIIISLTSYPARINTVEKTIKTLLNQTLKPKKIVLALGEDEFPNKENDLPESLRSLLSDKFEILWTPKDLRSYTKLVPALKEYPNDIIVTADDDIIYKKDWLEKLYEAYKKEPSLIHCHRAHRITFDKNKKIMPYREWVWGVKNVKPSFNNFLTGVGGVLYPPYVLNKDVFNIELFQKLAPLADDIWFWAMAVLNDTKINVIKNNNSSLVCIDGTQEKCLWKTNVDESKNDEQLNKVLEYYPEILEKLDKKKFRNVSFLQSLFSITNLPSKDEKWYRTVYFLGFKLSFRNMKKEEKMKILKESEGK